VGGMTSPTDRLTVPEVAEMLRCGPRKALSLMGNEIPAVLDYRWTAARADVQAYLDARTVTDRSGKNRRRGRGRRAA
jgi:hypothetical protein